MPDDIIQSLSPLRELERALARELELVDARAVAAFAWPTAGEHGVGVALELQRSLAAWADLPALCDWVAETVRMHAASTVAVVWLLEEGSLDPARCSAQLQANELHWIARLDQAGFERASRDEAATQTALELAGLAAEVLGLQQLAPADHLLARGADSVTCLRILTRVRERWGVSLEARDVFAAPRVAELAQRIDALCAAGSAVSAAVIPRVARDQRWPLSAAQLRHWLASQLDAVGPAQHVAGGLRLRGALDVRALRDAAERLAERHEILRTTIELEAGLPVQRVWPALPIPCELFAAAPLDSFAACVRRAAAQPFDLQAGPLFRIEIHPLAEDEHLLVLCMHHVISDGWSMELAACELLTLYAGASLAALPVQFIDYAAWDAAALAGGLHETQLAYWRARLATDFAPLDLPSKRRKERTLFEDRPPEARARTGKRSEAGPAVALPLAAELTEAMRALATELGTTPVVVLLASFQLWLARMTGRDEVRVGVPVLGRKHSDAERLIGCFVQTLVLRADIEPRASGRAFLRQVDDALRAAQANADLPFEALLKALAPERGADHNPLFQVTYNHLRTSQRELAACAALGGLQVERVARESAGSPFDLSLETEEDDAGRIRAQFVYPAALFAVETVQGFARTWLRLLQQLVAAPEQRVSEIEMLAPELFARFSGPHVSAHALDVSGSSVHELVVAQAARRPDAVALIGAGERWTFARLEAASRALAHELRAQGVGPEVRVGICVERGPRMIVAALGVWRARGAYVPLDPAYPAARREFITRDAGLSLVLTERELARACELGPAEIPPLPAAVSRVNPAQLAYVIYTSGSTGTPKGVGVSHGALAMHCRSVGAIYRATPGDCALHFASFTFDAAVEQWTMPLAHGARVLISPSAPWTGEEIFEAVRRERVTIVYPPTGHLRLLAQHALSQSESCRVRVVCVGGEAVSREDHALIMRALEPELFVNGYGPTEAVVTPLLWQSSTRQTPATHYVPIGRPVGERRAYVLDRELQPVAAGVVGEIYLGGEGLARGYHARAAQTAESFIPDPFSQASGARLYRSGDFGRWLDSGDVEYVGRKDDQVKVRGFRIELGEIESELRAQPEVREAVVVAWPERGTHKLVAYAVARDSAREENRTAAVRAALAAALPTHMVPSAFVWLPELPLSAHGKVDKRALPPPVVNLREFAEPRSEAERALAQVWTELLGVERIGLEDNFFELGGDSIAALQLVGRMRALGFAPGPRSVFEQQTLRALATVVRALQPTAASVPELGDRPIALTPIQRAFLEAQPPNPDHYNQAVLLGVRRQLELEQLSRALRAVIAAHPALRLAVSGLAGGDPVLRYAGVPEDVLECHELADEAAAQIRIEIAQRSLSLESGRLLRAVLFRGPRGDRLLIVVHHLAIDGVSFRILLEDLATACDAPELPAETTSCSRWAARLDAWASEPQLQAQAGYWRDQSRAEACQLTGVASARDRVGECERLISQVDATRTARLLGEAGRAYRMRPHELLLAALVRAVERWNGQAEFSVLLESHGRESPWSDFDLSRSIGWFTSVHPITLRAESDLGATLRSVKERVRSVPDAGLGYAASKLALPRPAITFNYLGKFGDVRGPFEVLSLEPGASVDPEMRAASPIVIDAWTLGDELTVRWVVCPSAMPRIAAARLVELFERALAEVVEHGASAPTALTPSDFPQVRLDAAELEALQLTAADVEQVYPVSALQHGMLFHAVSEPSSVAYFNQVMFELDGVTAEALEHAFHAAVARHEALRSGFTWQSEAGPLQIVRRNVRMEIARGEVCAGADREALRLGQRARPFDLAVPPLARLFLGTLPDRRVLVIWTSHHLALDGWSAARVLSEVLADTRGGRLSGLQAGVSHAELLAFRARGARSADEAFWRARLMELDEPTLVAATLPNAEPISSGVARATLDWNVLRSAAQALRVTPNTLVQAAWLLVLSRLTGRDVVCCGVTLSGRPAELAGSESLVGMYIQTLPLVHRVRPEEKVAAWLSRLMFENLALREYEHSALSDIQRWAALPGRALFDSLIVVENYPFDEVLDELEVFEETNYPLTLTVRARRDLLELRLTGGEPAARILGLFSHVVMQLVDQPEAHVGAIELISDVDARQLDIWNATARTLPERPTIVEKISEVARTRPDAIALVFEGQKRSYAELEVRTNRLARCLRARGVGPDARVAVLAERSFELVEALIAIAKAGGAYVPIDPELPDDRIAAMLADTAPIAVLTQTAHVDRLPSRERALSVALDVLDLHSASATPLTASLHPDNLAYVIYTSGSTGKPKGAANTQRGLRNRLAWMQHAFALGPDDVVLQKTPYAFDVSVWEFFWPLTTGSTLVIAAPGEHRDPARLARLIEQTGVTTLHFVPSMLHAFLAHAEPARCRSLRRVICSGEALSIESVRRAAELWPWAQLHNLYGPTEASIDVTHTPCVVSDAAVTIGRPIWNTALYVLDQHLARVPIGCTGELYLAGVGLARGYHASPALTAERFVPDPWGVAGSRMYRTGDLARVRADGAIEYLGRTDQQLKLRGFRIEPAEIEAALRLNPDVRDAVVIARKDEGATRLVGYVAASPEAPDAWIDALDASLRARLPEYMVPAQLVILPALPLTASGKLDRRALPAPERSVRTRVKPTTPLEAALLEVFREVLRAPGCGVHDDFLELGGDSLLSLQLIARARRLGIELNAKQIFEARTVAKLAALATPRAAEVAIARVARDTWMPLSYAQERLWFLAQLEADSAAYNISGAIRLRGALDSARLRAALQQLVARHEALRTRFEERDERGVQRIHASAEITLREVDVRGPAARARAREVFAAQTLEPFELDQCPLVRATLIALDTSDHVLVVTLHHLIADAGTISVLVDELRELYAGRELAPLELQYLDYAAWQRQSLSTGELERQVEYYRAQLGDEHPVIALPLDRARPATQSYRGDLVGFALDASSVAAIAKLAQRQGASTFMLLLAVFEAVLYRITGQRDLRVGMPVTHRSRVELERVAGVFVNTLVVRTHLDGATTFAQLLERVKDATLGAQAHRDLPFEQLVEALAPERSLSHNPLFQVMFDHQRGVVSQLRDMGGLEVTPFEAEVRATQLDLGLDTVEDDGVIRGTFTYATDLFERSTIETIAGRFQRVLAQVVRDPELRLCELDVLEARERATLMAATGPVQIAPRFGEGFVHLRISAQAERRPDAPALLSEQGESWSYARLERFSNQWAHRLRALGVGPEVRVGLCTSRSPRMIAGALAILKAGGAYVPLDPSYPLERLTTVVRGADLMLVVGERSQPVASKLGAERYAWLDAEDVSREPGHAPAVALSRENLAYVVYTSGSTGQPKGVAVSHGALASHVAAIGADYGMVESDCALHFASMSFDAGVEQWVSPLAHGARVLVRGDELWSAERAVEVLAQHRVSWFEMPPGYLREVAQAAVDRGERLRLRACSAGGEAVSRESLAVMLEAIAPAPLINGYGPTETLITPMTWHATDVSQCTTAYAPIGRVVGARGGYVLDAELNLVPRGVTGELYLGGIALARGYLDRPHWTAERFVPDPFAAEPGRRMYRTGDLARVCADGSVEYLGRADHQVKVRGFRIELGEVESQLLAQPGVREAVVVAQSGSVASRLIGYVAGDVDAARLSSQLRAALPEYMVPAQLVVLAALPRNENGKVDRKRLPAVEAAARAYVAPQSDVERQLCAIFEDVLGVTRVGATDNFFELGGDSIRSLQVISRARKHGIELRPRDIFERQTASELATAATQPAATELELAALSRDRELYRLSYAQERLWFLAQLEPESAAYNVSGAIRVCGPLNLGALQVAVDALVARHEALRTTFESHDGVPWQRIHAALELRVTVLDANASDARAHVEAAAHALFDLTAGPLLRVTVVRLAQDEHVLALAMHHIISDGGSLDLAIDELSQLYAAGTADLPPLPLQYVDFAHWQRERSSGADRDRQLDYWKSRLGTEHPVLALPTDHARPAVPSHAGRMIDFTIDASLSRGLRDRARAYGTTPFVLLLAAWQTFLYRLTGQRDVRVGVPMTNRNRLETERVIGFFVNTQVLCADLGPSQSFARVVAKTREQALGAQAHRDLPFERLVELFQPARNLGHNPLFQVMFNHLRRGQAPFARSSELQVSPFEWHSQISQFDLCLDTEEDADGQFSGRLTYATDLFEHPTAQRWVDQFVRGLGLLVSLPDTPIGVLPWLDPDERRALLKAGARREVVPGETLLHERIQAQALARRAHTACSYQGERLSYGALELRANQWARRLCALGVGPDVLVGLYLERSLDLVVGILAILKAGGAYLPLDPAAPAERIAYMLEDSRVSIVLTQSHLEERLPRSAALNVLALDREDVSAELLTPPVTNTRPDHLAYVIYTSGSTGKPKGALLSHRNVARLFDAAQPWFAFDERDVWTLFHSYAFDFSVWELFGALLYGGSLVIVPYDVSRSPAEFYELLVRERVTILNQTPSAFRQLSIAACAEPACDQLALRRVIFGGEALEPEMLRPWFDHFGDESPQLINMYGITETTVHVTYRPLRRADLARGTSSPIGEPLPDLGLYVLDDSLSPCAWGVTGELYVAGAGLAHGYLARPALTAERFVPNPFGAGRLYRSGDLAVRRADGSLEYLGRCDQQVKIRGFRIELGEIAAQLLSHPRVSDAVVIARPGPSGQRLLGYVTLHTAETPDTVDLLKQQLRRALPEYMVPSAIVVLAELPLTTNGKLDQKRLPEPSARAAEYVEPRTPIERQLAEIWTELLGVRVSRDADFFALGGHSLLVTQVMSRVQQQFGLALPLRYLFEASTLSSFAERLVAAGASEGTDSKLDVLDALLTDLENET